MASECGQVGMSKTAQENADGYESNFHDICGGTFERGNALELAKHTRHDGVRLKAEARDR
jgi:hypothetical protein